MLLYGGNLQYVDIKVRF